MRKKARKMKHIRKEIDKIELHDALSIVSRIGYINATNTFRWFQQYVQPNVDITTCKKRISKATKENL